MDPVTAVVAIIVAVCAAIPSTLGWLESRKTTKKTEEVKVAAAEIHVLVNKNMDEAQKKITALEAANAASKLKIAALDQQVATLIEFIRPIPPGPATPAITEVPP